MFFSSLLRSSTFQHPLPGRTQRTTILASNAQICIKGSMRPSPPSACSCVNQHHDTLAAAIGLSLLDLMATLIACRPAGSIIQHETECHMVASITWFAIRTLPAKDNLDLLHWFTSDLYYINIGDYPSVVHLILIINKMLL